MTVAKKAPSPDLIDQLLAGYQKPEDLIGEHGLLKQLTKAVVERALQAEAEPTSVSANCNGSAMAEYHSVIPKLLGLCSQLSNN